MASFLAQRAKERFILASHWKRTSRLWLVKWSSISSWRSFWLLTNSTSLHFLFY
ncbi:unnamed protein product [Meloidogyne enterolobii]|uniref:Uncharacterized protein n=1 Tax=Meloidogyne enterolobii TaxID=390850 RepID=A0ACB0YK18_MELEN